MIALRYDLEENLMKIQKLNKNTQPPMDLLLSADPSATLVKEYLEKGDCYVAEIKEEIIGVYILLPIKSQIVELINIAIREDYQNQGIGQELIQDAIGRAKDAGYKIIEIGTGNSSIYQLAFYQKCGFELDRIDKNFFIRNYEQPIYENGIQCKDMIRLKKEL